MSPLLEPPHCLRSTAQHMMGWARMKLREIMLIHSAAGGFGQAVLLFSSAKALRGRDGVMPRRRRSMGLIAKVSKSLDVDKGHIDNPEAVVRVRDGLVGCGGGSVVGSGATLGAETTVFEVLANSSMVELARNAGPEKSSVVGVFDGGPHQRTGVEIR